MIRKFTKITTQIIGMTFFILVFTGVFTNNVNAWAISTAPALYLDFEDSLTGPGIESLGYGGESKKWYNIIVTYDSGSKI